MKCSLASRAHPHHDDAPSCHPRTSHPQSHHPVQDDVGYGDMRIYITHCSAKKDNALINSGKKVTPEKLYTATPTQRFMRRCVEQGVDWAIFSDMYGVWYCDETREWYDKHPDSVTKIEFEYLLNDFDTKLQKYDEIWFYYNPGRFHNLYRRLLSKSKLKNKFKLFTHIDEID